MSIRLILKKLSSTFSRAKSVKNVMFGKYLLITNLGLSVGLSGVGDVLQQRYMIIKGEKELWDKKRTGHMSITGLTVGAVCHHWYIYLDRKLPGRAARAVFKKVFLDQIFFSPIYISIFFITSGLLENESFEEIVDEIFEKGKQLYMAEWIVWPPAQLINFFFLPTQYRIFYDNTISLGYDIYTSHVKHSVK